MASTIIPAEKVQKVANYFCFAKSVNPAFGDLNDLPMTLGIWVFQEGAMVHNYLASDRKSDRHHELIIESLKVANSQELGYSKCLCGQCSIMLVDDIDPIRLRKIVWDTVMDVANMPHVPEDKLTHLLFNRPDMPDIRRYVEFMNRLSRCPQVKCAHAVTEGNYRIQSKVKRESH